MKDDGKPLQGESTPTQLCSCLWQNSQVPTAPHLLHQLLPFAVGLSDEAVAMLLQLPIIELIIGELEDGSMGPGGQGRPYFSTYKIVRFPLMLIIMQCHITQNGPTDAVAAFDRFHLYTNGKWAASMSCHL